MSFSKLLKHSLLLTLCIFAFADIQAQDSKKSDAGQYVPEEGSAELGKKKRKKKGKAKVDPNLPFVLIIGDSIAIGYTGKVAQSLKGKANVIHNPGNAQGTSFGLTKLKSWIGDRKWDVIHFNWGLHDLKRVKVAGTSQNSTDPNDPYQATVEQYSENMKKLVATLKNTGSKLIFATTTPYPTVNNPYRDEKDAAIYNAAALKIMEENSIEVNDLHGVVKDRLEELQKPKNVHFKGSGSAALAKKVSEAIEAALQK